MTKKLKNGSVLLGADDTFYINKNQYGLNHIDIKFLDDGFVYGTGKSVKMFRII